MVVFGVRHENNKMLSCQSPFATCCLATGALWVQSLPYNPIGPCFSKVTSKDAPCKKAVEVYHMIVLKQMINGSDTYKADHKRIHCAYNSNTNKQTM